MRRPSPALVISIVALCVALGGTGYAAESSGGGQPMQAAKKKKHKRRGAHGPRGPRGLVGPKGDTGPSGPPGPPGQAGLTGSARAYAYVAAGSGKPSLDPARTKGFTGVAKGSLTGIYCLTPAAGIDPASSVALVSVVYNSAFANEPEEADPAYDVCPAGHFGVYTFSGAPRSGTPNLDFTIAVP